MSSRRASAPNRTLKSSRQRKTLFFVLFPLFLPACFLAFWTWNRASFLPDAARKSSASNAAPLRERRRLSCLSCRRQTSLSRAIDKPESLVPANFAAASSRAQGLGESLETRHAESRDDRRAFSFVGEEEQDDFDVKILATNPRAQPVASGIRAYFSKAGLSPTVVETVDIRDARSDVVYFVLTPCEQEIPEKIGYVVYQWEKHWTQQATGSLLEKRAHDKLLKDALFVLDFSVLSYQRMDAKTQRKSAYLPAPLNFVDEDSYDDEIEYDVLFCGDACPRSKRILETLQRDLETLRGNRGAKLKVAGAVVGTKLDEVIKKARVVLNLHCFDDALLETAQINRALRLNKIVVSEEPVAEDKYSRHLYKDVVVFTKKFDAYGDGDVHALARTLEFYSQPEHFDAYVERRRARLLSLENYIFSRFKKALVSLRALPPTSFHERLRPPETTIHYLSLDESWQTRRETFLEQPHVPAANVERIPAIKASPGWIGCGMSYKFAINSARASRLRHVTICEDDARFPPAFERDYGVVLEYLSSLDRWDIFVGLIADFHKDTRILEVEEYKGLEFVTIDRFTSTVFNVYNRSSFDHILSWNDRDTNMLTNTIDRFLQSRNLTIVTTNPYFVKHMEVGSTIWGNRTEYTEWLATSSRVFAVKVEKFKREKAKRNRYAGGRRGGSRTR